MKQKVCEWKYAGVRDNYNTQCGVYFSFIDSTLKESGFKFCPFCSKKIKEVKE